MDIHCPICGNKAPDNKSQFCDKCGNKLPGTLPQNGITTCVACGKTAPASTSLFCDSCGTKLPQPTTINYGKVCTACRRMAPTSGSEFCDVCGTRLTPLPPPITRDTTSPPPAIHSIASQNKTVEVLPTGAEETPESVARNNSTFSVFVLRFALLFGIVGFFIDPLIGIVVVVVSAYAVYQDAKELHSGSFTTVKPFQMITWRPSHWGLVVLVVWIVGLPLYLVHREQLLQIFIRGGLLPDPPRETAAESRAEPVPGPFVEGDAKHLTESGGEPEKKLTTTGEFEPVIEMTAEIPDTGLHKQEQSSAVSGAPAYAMPGMNADEGCMPEPEPLCDLKTPGSGSPPSDMSLSRNPEGAEIREIGMETKPGRVTRSRLAIVILGIIVLALVLAVFQMGMVPEVSQLPALNLSLPQTTSAPTVNVLSVGESVSDGRSKLTVHGYEIKDKIGSKTPGDLDKEKKGYSFMVVDITVENQQFIDGVSSGEFYLINNEGYLYTAEQVPGLDSLFNGTDIRPLEKRRGNLAFSVPADAGELRLKTDLGSNVIALFLIT